MSMVKSYAGPDASTPARVQTQTGLRADGRPASRSWPAWISESFGKSLFRRPALAAGLALGLLSGAGSAAAADKVDELRLDYAYYNPLSLVLKEKGWLEQALAADGTKVRWVLSLGSNKALEFLNAGSIDVGSSAGAAALLARINGNPVKAIYVFSRPEWTALVTRADTGIKTVEDLKGKRIAATRGTDPHIFLIRTLAEHGLSEKDVRIVLLQHQDGRLALSKGDVDAWAGLDPLMARAELEDGAHLFYRNPEINTWGVLDTSEDFAAHHPELLAKVLEAYEQARAFSLAHPDELKAIIAAQAKLTDEVAARQLERTDLTSGAIGERQRQTIEGAGLALQQAGVVPATVDVPAVATALVDASFVQRLGIK